LKVFIIKHLESTFPVSASNAAQRRRFVYVFYAIDAVEQCRNAAADADRAQRGRAESEDDSE